MQAARRDLSSDSDEPFTGANRAQEEDVKLAPAAVEILTKIGTETSLREYLAGATVVFSLEAHPIHDFSGYVIQLITLSNLVARRRKSTQVEVADVRRVYTLWVELTCHGCQPQYVY